MSILIDILFILNYKSGTKLAKIYSTGNAMFIPTYEKNKRTCQKSRGTVQTCRKENAILLVWSQDKYDFNFHEFLKLSRACDIVQKNIAKISLFVMFIYFFFFGFHFLFLFFLTICHPPPVTRGKVLPLGVRYNELVRHARIHYANKPLLEHVPLCIHGFVLHDFEVICKFL